MNAQTVIDRIEETCLAASVIDRAYLQWQVRWISEARPEQVPPDEGWTDYGCMAGRGWGKTRVGAEWLGRVAFEDPEALPRCLVAPTQNDARFTCFEGVSGLLNVVPPECIRSYSSGDLLLILTNGASIRGFSAEKADRLRGPEHADAWCFTAGTLVTMADGSQRPIEQVRQFDWVWTRLGPRPVLATRSREAYVGRVSFDNGVELVGTGDHPVYLARGWTALGQLQQGDEVCASSAARPSSRVPVTSAASVASTWRPEGHSTVFCLTVADAPEFFANGILVHNCDEVAAWGKDAEYTLDMLAFGLRIGPHPRTLWTTTPRPLPVVRRLLAPAPGNVIVRGTTYDNRANLSKTFYDKIAVYEGTRMGRQEIHGELIDPEESGVIKRSWIRLWPADKPLPPFELIIMSLDTAFTEKTMDKKSGDPDPTACSVWGLFTEPKVPNSTKRPRKAVMLLDCWEDWLGLPELVRRVKRELKCAYGGDEERSLVKPLFGSDKPRTAGRKPDLLVIEDKGSGISLRQTLYEAGIDSKAYNPGNADKLARLHIVSPVFAHRRVWAVESNTMPGKPRSWADPLISQLCSFAGEGSVKHDDHVDTCTQALRVLMDMGLLLLVREPTGEEPPPDPSARTNPYAA